MRYINITTNLTTNKVTYTLGNPILSVQNPGYFSISRPNEGLARFGLNYTYNCSNTAFISNFNQSDGSFEVYSLNFSLGGNYLVIITAQFNDYNPGYNRSVQLTLNLINPCFTNYIQGPTTMI